MLDLTAAVHLAHWSRATDRPAVANARRTTRRPARRLRPVACPTDTPAVRINVPPENTPWHVAAFPAQTRPKRIRSHRVLAGWRSLPRAAWPSTVVRASSAVHGPVSAKRFKRNDGTTTAGPFGSQNFEATWPATPHRRVPGGLSLAKIRSSRGKDLESLHDTPKLGGPDGVLRWRAPRGGFAGRSRNALGSRRLATASQMAGYLAWAMPQAAPAKIPSRARPLACRRGLSSVCQRAFRPTLASLTQRCFRVQRRAIGGSISRFRPCRPGLPGSISGSDLVFANHNQSRD
jgi:hypothetical protein